MTSDLRLVGLTGKNAAGKGEVARLLQAWGYRYRSLSDILREEATARNLSPSREVLISLGQELRRQEGAGVLAARTVPLLGAGLHVIDSIRNPAEISILRKAGNCLLLGVDAPIEVRFERAQARGREENASSLEEFRKMENRERSNDPLTQQLDHCLKEVDVMILNDGSLKTLETRLRQTLIDRSFSTSN